MNRFIVINNCLVNVRHIVMAVDEANGTTAFHLGQRRGPAHAEQSRTG